MTTPDPHDAARDRAQALAAQALARGEPTAWFERLYREAGGDPSRVPWADLAPDSRLVQWTKRADALEGVRSAVVVGCGLGHDAEHLASLGVPDVVAFDVSPTAIAWARRLHPRSRVRYETADLFAPPSAWRGAFDLVVEVVTLQALPLDARAPAFAAVASLVRPGGRLFLATRLRSDSDASPSGPPWPLSLREVDEGFPGFRWDVPLTDAPDARDPSIRRAWGVLRKPS